MKEYYDELMKYFNSKDGSNIDIDDKLPRNIGKKIDIESMTGISHDEEIILNCIRSGKTFPYKQFLYVFHNKDYITVIQKRIEEIYKQHPILRTMFTQDTDKRDIKLVVRLDTYQIPIKDISYKTKSEQKQMLKNLTAAEYRRSYVPERCSIVRALIMKLDEAEYAFILSICDYPNLDITGLQIIEQLFDLKPKNLKSIEPDTKSKLLSRGYWNKLLAQLPKPTVMPFAGENIIRKSKTAEKVLISQNKKNDTKESSDETPIKKEACILLLPDEINKFTADYQREHVSDIRSIFLIAWGLLLGQYYKQTSVLLGMMWDSGEIKTAPVVIDCSIALRQIIQNTDQQLEDLLKYDACNDVELASYLKNQANTYFTTKHHFLDMSDVAKIIDNNSTSDEVLTLSAAAETESKMTVTYNLYEKDLSIGYVFDTDYYSLESVKNLHNTYITILENVFNLAAKLYSNKLVVEELTADTDRQNQEAAQKALYMKKSHIFDSLAADELLQMSKLCRLRVLLCEDILINEKASSATFYILGNGNIEVSKVGTDGYITTIKVLNEGEIFGIESLFTDNTSEMSYTVLSSTATVLEIPKTIMESFMSKHIDIWREILTYQTNELQKYQKLWNLS